MGVASGAVSGASVGAVAGPWGALAGGVGGAILGGIFGDDSVEARRRAGLEQARVKNIANTTLLGETSTRAAASGLELGTSPAGQPGQTSMAQYLAAMGNEFRRANDANVRAVNEGADLDSEANLLNTFSGIGSSLFKFGASNNFWQSTPAKAYDPLSSVKAAP